MTEAEQIMKRCQIGTRNYEEANNLHAACYGIIGKLLAQPEQEPVAWVCINNKKHDIDFDQPEIDAIPVGTMLYTHPQRTWVGLTNEDISKISQRLGIDHDDSWTDLKQAIEAKLKQKNS